MAETALTAALADALSATTDTDTDLVYPTIGEATYYTTMYRQLQRIAEMAKMPGNALRVCQDGALTVEIRPGHVVVGSTEYDYAGSAGDAVADNQTNYVYVTETNLGADTVTINTSGFPSDGTFHIPLAVVLTGSASASGTNFHYRDITDWRDRGILAVTGYAQISAEAEGTYAANERRITIQGISARQLVRLWVGVADYGAPSATDNAVTIETGTIYETETAHAAYKIITGSGGELKFDLTIAGAATRYVMAEIDGKIYSSGALTWSA